MLKLKLYPNGEFSLYPEPTVSSRKFRPRKDRTNPLYGVPTLEPDPFGILRYTKDISNAHSYLVTKPALFKHVTDGFFIVSIPEYNCLKKEEYEYRCIKPDGSTFQLKLPKTVEELSVIGSSLVPLFVRYIGTIPPLVYQLLHSSHYPTKPRQRKRLSFRGGRLIRNLAFCLQEEYGKSNIAFLTLTVPNLSREYLEAVRLNWGSIITQFLHAVTQKYRRAWGEALPYLSVTELQEKRFIKTNGVAPHEHIVYHARKPDGGWLYSPKQIRKLWRKCIVSSLQGTGIPAGQLRDYRSCENLVMVRKDVSRYLSKYLSKGTSVPSKGHEDRRGYTEQVNQVSGRWYRASRKVYGLLKKAIRVFGGIVSCNVGEFSDYLNSKGTDGRPIGRCYKTIINLNKTPSFSISDEEDNRRLPNEPMGICIYTGWCGTPQTESCGIALGILSGEDWGSENCLVG